MKERPASDLFQFQFCQYIKIFPLVEMKVFHVTPVDTQSVDKDEDAQINKEIRVSKGVLLFTSLVFLICGFSITAIGAVILNDSPLILISRLLAPEREPPEPILYYVALAILAFGLIVSATSILGCWAACLQTTCLLTSYMIIVVLTLMCESALGVLAFICPEAILFEIKEILLVDAIHRHYGTPGWEQLTAAIDLTQATMQCCGIHDSNDYAQSLWRMQSRSLMVPLSCCFPEGLIEDSTNWWDPKPSNLTQCQADSVNDHYGARHVDGCVLPLARWARAHRTMLFSGGLGIMMVEISVLLSAILVCLKRPRRSRPS